MAAMGTVSVLLFHTVVAGELPSPPVNPTSGKELAHPSVQLAQGWRYRHFSGWQPAPTYVSVCEGYECSPHYNDRELPWRPVSLSLSAGFAHSDGGDVTVGGSGGALGVRLGAGLVGRLSLTVGFEGTSSRRGDKDETEGAALIGLQWYPLPFLYFRGAFGAGVVSYANPGADASYAGGESNVLHPALSAAVGIECARTDSFAFGLEGLSTWIHVPGENWSSVQLNMVVSLF